MREARAAMFRLVRSKDLERHRSKRKIQDLEPMKVYALQPMKETLLFARQKTCNKRLLE